MGLFNGCLLACDIDGTLMVNEEISPRNREKIEYFVSEGGTFALATGRAVGAVSLVLKLLPDLIGPSVVANGCMIYDYKTGSILFEREIEDADKFVVKEAYERFKEVGIEVHCGKDVFTLNANKEIIEHQVHEFFTSSEIPLRELLKQKWNKVLYASEDLQKLEEFKSYAGTLSVGCQFMNTLATLGGRKRYYFEQAPSGINKLSSIRKLCELLNIKKGGFFAIGDYYNDLEMITAADIGAAPCDSPEDIKSKAKFITGKAIDGAVADFIDYLTQIKK